MSRLSDALRKASPTHPARAARARLQGGHQNHSRCAAPIPLAMGELRSLLFDPAYSPFFNEDDVMDVLVARMRPDDVVFDIGAYHGVWAVLLARHAREVVAFEPNPGTFAVLQETIAVNRAPQCLGLPACDRQRVAATPISGAPAAAQAFAPDSTGRHVLACRSRRSTALSSAGASLPDVLKIDVEGAEHQVLTRRAPLPRACAAGLHRSSLRRAAEIRRGLLDDRRADDRRRLRRNHARYRPTRLGAEDQSRMHVIWEKTSESGQPDSVASVSF